MQMTGSLMNHGSRLEACHSILMIFGSDFVDIAATFQSNKRVCLSEHLKALVSYIDRDIIFSENVVTQKSHACSFYCMWKKNRCFYSTVCNLPSIAKWCVFVACRLFKGWSHWSSLSRFLYFWFSTSQPWALNYCEICLRNTTLAERCMAIRREHSQKCAWKTQ